MNLRNYWSVFESAVPTRICDHIIEFGEMHTTQTALTGGIDQVPDNEKDLFQLHNVRNSSIAWLNEPWILREINPYINEANNQSNWNFELMNTEQFQFTKYRESQHYTWHRDSFPAPFHEPRNSNDGLVRKISVTVSLSDGEDYDGGDFEIDLRDGLDQEQVNNIVTLNDARKKGSIIIFPSFVWHRVKPVLSGTRYSLVIWCTGLPFK